MKTAITQPGKIHGKAMLLRKYNYYIHIGCGGSIMYDGLVTNKKAIDLAVAGTEDGAAIMVKHRITKYVSGGCLKCKKDGLFEIGHKDKVSTRIKKLKLPRIEFAA